MRIEDGWLVGEDWDPAVSQVRTPKYSALSAGVDAPLGVVWHWTGRLGMDAADYCREDAGNKREASWHLMIARDGRVIQGVSFLRGSWHVGRKGLIAGQERSVNGCTVGIELENNGRLKKVEGVWRYFSGGKWKGEVPESETVAVAGQGVFHDFPAAQRTTAAIVLAALVGEYGWTVDDCSYGHIDFAAPGSREDPGPRWGAHRWPDGLVLREVLESAFGMPSAPVGLPTFCDDPDAADNVCGDG